MNGPKFGATALLVKPSRARGGPRDKLARQRGFLELAGMSGSLTAKAFSPKFYGD